MFAAFGMAFAHLFVGLFMLACATLGIESVCGLPWGATLEQVHTAGLVQICGAAVFAGLGFLGRRHA